MTRIDKPAASEVHSPLERASWPCSYMLLRAPQIGFMPATASHTDTGTCQLWQPRLPWTAGHRCRPPPARVRAAATHRSVRSARALNLHDARVPPGARGRKCPESWPQQALLAASIRTLAARTKATFWPRNHQKYPKGPLSTGPQGPLSTEGVCFVARCSLPSTRLRAVPAVPGEPRASLQQMAR